MNKKQFDDDDGRVVADMSDIGRQPLIIPRFDRLGKSKPEQQEPSTEDKPWENNELSGREKRSFIAGALGATILIASVFAIAGAVVILIISKLGA